MYISPFRALSYPAEKTFVLLSWVTSQRHCIWNTGKYYFPVPKMQVSNPKKSGICLLISSVMMLWLRQHRQVIRNSSIDHIEHRISGAFSSMKKGFTSRCLTSVNFSTDQGNQYVDTATISALHDGLRAGNTSEQFMGTGGCFTNVSRTLQNTLVKMYKAPNDIYGENFKHGFGHTYKVSPWNSHNKHDWCNTQISR